MKTDAHPMKVKLKLYFDWGIRFSSDKPYAVKENGNRKVEYVDRKELMESVIRKYHPEYRDEDPVAFEAETGASGQGFAAERQFNASDKRRDAITEPAGYVLAITDLLGNRAEISFEIVRPLVKEFVLDFSGVEEIDKITVNGEEIQLNHGMLELKTDGVYEMEIVFNGIAFPKPRPYRYIGTERRSYTNLGIHLRKQGSTRSL